MCSRPSYSPNLGSRFPFLPRSISLSLSPIAASLIYLPLPHSIACLYRPSSLHLAYLSSFYRSLFLFTYYPFRPFSTLLASIYSLPSFYPILFLFSPLFLPSLSHSYSTSIPPALQSPPLFSVLPNSSAPPSLSRCLSPSSSTASVLPPKQNQV